MQRRLGAKLTCFVVQKYDLENQIFVITLQSCAVTKLPQDLGGVAVSSLGNTFAVHHCMLLESAGALSRDLLALCSSETAPVLTLSILSIYASAESDVAKLVKSASSKCYAPASGDAEMPLLDCSSNSPIWPIGPLLIFHPHITLSPTSLPSFSAMDCIFSFFSFAKPTTYPMHLGTVLHNVVQSKFVTEATRAKTSDQLAMLKAAWIELELEPDELPGVISASKIPASMKVPYSPASMKDKILYELLKNEPVISLQNNDLEFIDERAAIDTVSKLACDAASTREALQARHVEYFVEKHIASTDLGMQGKIDLFGLLKCEETGEIQRKDIIELKTTSTSGAKREAHFMQACTYFYATCLEQKAASDTLLGCDVIGIKQGRFCRPFQLFGTQKFVTCAELAKKQPHNPLFYFLQLYTVFRVTYLLLLELSVYLVTMVNAEECCIDSQQFFDILRKHEPKYLRTQADNASFLRFLFTPGGLKSTTMTSIRKELVSALLGTYHHITGDSLTPLAVLSHFHTVRVGNCYYSFVHLKSGSLTVTDMYRLRFLVTTHVSSSPSLDQAHCVVSNILMRVLACGSSSQMYSQIALLESSYDLSSVYSPPVSEVVGVWAAYPLLPNGTVAGRSLSILMSSPMLRQLSFEEIIDAIDQKLLTLERSVQHCPLKFLEDAVKGPFYNDSILLLVNKEDAHKLPTDLLAVFARRGICTVPGSDWPAKFSDAELVSVITRQISPADLFSSVTSKCTAFSNSLTKMAAVAPMDLLDLPILRQSYGTIYVFIDFSNSQGTDMLNYAAVYNDFYAVLATLPEYKRVFFICS
ncbi:hypothetical protein GL50803_0015192 [Giardia duodenalis]|uniref:Uncharacterized protein n=1 Tax=Giardia intestinalis (strain ATCC 50803 / WB clone C6) TaxID=184922 RepID=A0A644F5E6_GIAIC|nr:hypothetical protein GL50803_0015192 [Giardia intestinalis]KAE8303853.1 hypothetical protein GL50803_0015192 [Giardia intestinalis]